MRFSVTSLLGQWGQICFSEFLKIISSFFAQNFCTDRVDILLCSATNEKGVTVEILALFAPSKYCGRRRQARARLRPRRVLEKFGDFLTIHDLQFGFKKGLGCQNAIFTVQQVIFLSTVVLCTSLL